MNIKSYNLKLWERLTVYVAMSIYYTLIFALFATVFILALNGMIDYLTLEQYDISTL